MRLSKNRCLRVGHACTLLVIFSLLVISEMSGVITPQFFLALSQAAQGKESLAFSVALPSLSVSPRPFLSFFLLSIVVLEDADWHIFDTEIAT